MSQVNDVSAALAGAAAFLRILEADMRVLDIEQRYAVTAGALQKVEEAMQLLDEEAEAEAQPVAPKVSRKRKAVHHG